MSWSGPYKILEQINRVNYLIDEKGKAKLYHVNMLKQYFRRSVVVQAVDDNVEGVANFCEPDYHALNHVTVFNAEPSCAIEEDVHKFSGANFFTELDLRRIMKFLCQKELCL